MDFIRQVSNTMSDFSKTYKASLKCMEDYLTKFNTMKIQ